MYISRLQKAIILSREKEYQQGLGVIYHELSHHLTLQITAGRPPIWFNEDLPNILNIVKLIKRTSAHVYRLRKRKNPHYIYVGGH